jgi:hypothetical protein
MDAAGTPLQRGMDQIGPYELVAHLGGGAHAQTFKGMRDGDFYAVKILLELPALADGGARFEREIDAMRIRHPNLVEYVDHGIGQWWGAPRAYIVMPYEPGMNLKKHLRQAGGRLGWKEAVDIARQMASGLVPLHDAGAIHRDLKPANIYVTITGKVRILDFGLAKLQDRSSITKSGDVPGTPAYLAPEQLRDEPDMASDLYALGATLYEMLTGARPFANRASLEALALAIRLEQPEPPQAIEPSVPDWLDGLVLRLLEKEPALRPAGARALESELARGPRSPKAPAREPYDREQPPRLCVRANSRKVAGAVLDAALYGEAPNYAIAPITQQDAIDELLAARGHTGCPVAVDTMAAETTGRRHASVVALCGQEYAPEGLEPFTEEELRPRSTANRIALADARTQDRKGADLLRATSYFMDSAQSKWLSRNATMLDASLDARQAVDATKPVFAVINTEIAAVMRQDDRLSMLNRFARGEREGYWAYLAELDSQAPEEIVAALQFLLMPQDLGLPTIGRLPSTLYELAWSLGLAAIEATPGRVGAHIVPGRRTWGRAEGRFYFHSLMFSAPAGLAARILATELLPESDCPCRTCQAAGSYGEQALCGHAHDLSAWIELRGRIPEAMGDRSDRLHERLNEVNDNLAKVRKKVPEVKNLRHVQPIRAALELIETDALLAPGQLLRRAA